MEKGERQSQKTKNLFGSGINDSCLFSDFLRTVIVKVLNFHLSIGQSYVLMLGKRFLK